MPLEQTPEFCQAMDLLEKGTENLFITGRAGTGKSTLLAHFRATTKENVVVLAPTGVAAINVGGQTIHSFFGFKPNITPEGVKKKKGELLKFYKKLEAVVIDEISMVRADLLDAVARFLELNGRKPGTPFGGVRMIFFGDLYQLPPVVRTREAEVFRLHYETPYFFSAKSFEDLALQWIELTKVFRQTDVEFLDLLNRVRNQTISDKELDQINRRVLGDTLKPPETDVISLTTTKRVAEEINVRKLNRLPGKKFVFHALVNGDFDASSYPTEAELALKVGAQVMLLNNDAYGRWINGTLAKIKAISRKEESIVVVLPEGREEEVAPYRWDLFHFSVEANTQRLVPVSVGTFTQIPVRLAWAITIHKSQGLTFDQAVLDLTHKTFAHGQLYVAISRLRTLNGLFLTHPIQKKDIFLDYRVQKFMTSYQYAQSEKKLSLEEKMAIIDEAIARGDEMAITYLTPSNEKTERTIRPITVGPMTFQEKMFLGVVAYCEIRKAKRTFRVDRILAIHTPSL